MTKLILIVAGVVVVVVGLAVFAYWLAEKLLSIGGLP